MKLDLVGHYVEQMGRPTPHGVGGLKYNYDRQEDWVDESHPSRGGWIEMASLALDHRGPSVPPLTGWVD